MRTARHGGGDEKPPATTRKALSTTQSTQHDGVLCRYRLPFSRGIDARVIGAPALPRRWYLRRPARARSHPVCAIYHAYRYRRFTPKRQAVSRENARHVCPPLFEGSHSALSFRSVQPNATPCLTWLLRRKIYLCERSEMLGGECATSREERSRNARGVMLRGSAKRLFFLPVKTRAAAR